MMMQRRYHISPRFFITGWLWEEGCDAKGPAAPEGAAAQFLGTATSALRSSRFEGLPPLKRAKNATIIRERSYCSSGSTELINCVYAYPTMKKQGKGAKDDLIYFSLDNTILPVLIERLSVDTF